MADYTSVNKPKLLDQVRFAIRTKHYSIRTEEAYVHWAKRYIRGEIPRQARNDKRELHHASIWKLARIGAARSEPLCAIGDWRSPLDA